MGVQKTSWVVAAVICLTGALIVPAGAGAAAKLTTSKAKKVAKREAKKRCERGPYKCRRGYDAYSCERQSRRKVTCEAAYLYRVNPRATGVCNTTLRIVKEGGKIRTKKLRPWSCLN